MNTTPNITSVLDAFFSDAAVGKAAATRERYLRTHAALVRFLDSVDIASELGEDAWQIVAAEREFDANDAFVRVLTAESLVAVLPGFVERLPACRTDARTRISLTDRLVSYLVRFRLIDELAAGTPILRARVACADARDRLREPAEPRLFG